jgi:3-phenylpropionate/cinnamic acid dioxygenase small subunit
MSIDESRKEDLLHRAALREEITEFLVREAELLDNQELHEWYDLTTEDIDYRMPVRVTRERGAEQSEFSDRAHIFKEDDASIDARVRRFDTDYAWSENPPTRMRRFVSNVRFEEIGEEELTVTDNLLMYRAKEDETDPDIICGERMNVLRRTDDGLKLAKRVVNLDQTVLNTRPLSIFL